MLRRFADRLQLWHQQKRSEHEGANPLTFWAVAAVLAFAFDIRDLWSSPSIAWGALVHLILMLGFLVMYFRKSPSAWLIVPLLGVMFLFQLPFTAASSPPRPPLVWWLSALFALGLIAFGFFVKRRYQTYLEIEQSTRY